VNLPLEASHVHTPGLYSTPEGVGTIQPSPLLAVSRTASGYTVVTCRFPAAPAAALGQTNKTNLPRYPVSREAQRGRARSRRCRSPRRTMQGITSQGSCVPEVDIHGAWTPHRVPSSSPASWRPASRLPGTSRRTARPHPPKVSLVGESPSQTRRLSGTACGVFHAFQSCASWRAFITTSRKLRGPFLTLQGEPHGFGLPAGRTSDDHQAPGLEGVQTMTDVTLVPWQSTHPVLVVENGVMTIEG
jgi:hypothetical protein